MKEIRSANLCIDENNNNNKKTEDDFIYHKRKPVCWRKLTLKGLGRLSLFLLASQVIVDAPETFLSVLQAEIYETKPLRSQVWKKNGVFFSDY